MVDADTVDVLSNVIVVKLAVVRIGLLVDEEIEPVELVEALNVSGVPAEMLFAAD